MNDAAVLASDGAGDRQAEAGAGAPAARVEPHESLEDPLALRRRDTRAVVHHANEGLRRRALERHADTAVGRCRARRVVEQVP